LAIQTSLACNNDIRVSYFRFQSNCFGDNFESGPDLRAAKTQQSEAEPARRTRAGFVPIIKSKLFGHHIGQPGERPFQNVDLTLYHAFLWTEDSRRAVLPEQRIPHINRSSDF